MFPYKENRIARKYLGPRKLDELPHSCRIDLQLVLEWGYWVAGATPQVRKNLEDFKLTASIYLPTFQLLL